MKYQIRLSGVAHVEQFQEIEADSLAGAKAIAREKMNDNVWSYEGLTDDNNVLIEQLSKIPN